MIGQNLTCDTLPDQIMKFIIIFILKDVFVYVYNYIEYYFAIKTINEIHLVYFKRIFKTHVRKKKK